MTGAEQTVTLARLFWMLVAQTLVLVGVIYGFLKLVFQKEADALKARIELLKTQKEGADVAKQKYEAMYDYLQLVEPRLKEERKIALDKKDKEKQQDIEDLQNQVDRLMATISSMGEYATVAGDFARKLHALETTIYPSGEISFPDPVDLYGPGD